MSDQNPPPDPAGPPDPSSAEPSSDPAGTAPVTGLPLTSPVPGPPGFGTEVPEAAPEVPQPPATYPPYTDPYASYGAPVPYDPYAAAPAYAGGGYPPPPAGGSGGGASGIFGSSDTNSVLWKAVIAGVIAGLIAGLIAGFAGFVLASGTVGKTGVLTTGQKNPSDPGKLSPRADNSIAAIAKVMLPTVASITVKAGESGSSGSGFAINDTGYILTNNHVVAEAAKGASISVKFQGSDAQSATIVGRNPSYDLAVIKIDKATSAAKLGNSGTVAVGDAAIAIGSPLGLDGTVTSGIISAINRPVTAGGQGEASFINALQTDAPINPGNSGGPLVNSEAQVIGVNSAIATLGASMGGSQSGSIGLGFAIPINTAKRIADEIIATGKSTTPIIGVTVDLKYPGPGAKIATVAPGGPAAKAGLQPGDVIIAVDGQPNATTVEVLTAIRARQPGEVITLTVLSPSGGTKDVKLTLGSKTD